MRAENVINKYGRSIRLSGAKKAYILGVCYGIMLAVLAMLCAYVIKTAL